MTVFSVSTLVFALLVFACAVKILAKKHRREMTKKEKKEVERIILALKNNTR